MELTNIEIDALEATADKVEQTQQRVLGDLGLVFTGGGLAEASLY